jgi:hypothetical protein
VWRSFSSAAVQRVKQNARVGVIAEGFAQVREPIDISWTEEEAAAELEGIQAEFVLVMSGCAGALAALEIIAPNKVKDVGRAQVGHGIGLPSFVDQERKIDAGFFAENAGVVAIAKADRGERSALGREFLLVLAQLRDMLAAKNSSVVTKEHNDGRVVFPQRA